MIVIAMPGARPAHGLSLLRKYQRMWRSISVLLWLRIMQLRILPKPSEKSKPPMEIKAMFKSLSELRAIISRMTLKNETQTVNALVGLSENLRAENNNDENSKSIK